MLRGTVCQDTFEVTHVAAREMNTKNTPNLKSLKKYLELQAHIFISIEMSQSPKSILLSTRITLSLTKPVIPLHEMSQGMNQPSYSPTSDTPNDFWISAIKFFKMNFSGIHFIALR